MIIKVTASSGRTACPGHTGGLGTELDVQVMDGDLGHGVHVHMPMPLVAGILCWVLACCTIEEENNRLACDHPPLHTCLRTVDTTAF